MKTVIIKLALLSALLTAGMTATATPIGYNYDDGNAFSDAGFAGAGMFTLDLDDGFANSGYDGTDVMGGPGTFLGAWDSVQFLVIPTLAQLTIRDATGLSYIRNVLASDYGADFTGAAAAWDQIVNDPRGTFAGVEISAKVPEPGTLAMLALGVAGLGTLRRRRS